MINKIVLSSPSKILYDMQHLDFHIKECLEVFPDIQVQESSGDFLFYSKDANALADSLDFTNEDVGAYSGAKLHFAHPSFMMETKCKICNDNRSVSKIKIRTQPTRIPVALILLDEKNGFAFTTSFEDFFRQNKFSSNLIGMSRVYILNLLKDKEFVSKRMDEILLCDSIKNLMVFS